MIKSLKQNKILIPVFLAIVFGLLFSILTYTYRENTYFLFNIVCLLPFAFGFLVFWFKKSEQKLLQVVNKEFSAQKKLDLLYKNSPYGFAFCTMDGVYLETNSEFDRITGYSKAELNRLSYWDLTPEKFAEQEKEQLNNLETTGKYGPYRKEYKRKNGDLIPLTLSGFIVDNFDGVKGIWSIVEDISEDLKNEEVISTALEKMTAAQMELKFVLDSLGHYALISETDFDGKITRANENLCKMSGYSEDEIIGKTHHVFSSNIHSKDFWFELWRVLKVGKIWRQKIKNKTKAGQFYWVDSIIFPIFNSEGVIDKFQNISFDITKEMASQEALETERVKAAQLGRLAFLGEVAAGIAHEINNPLTIIAGNLSQIQRIIQQPDYSNDSIKIQKASDTCHKQVGRITKIISGLRKFARKDETQTLENIEIDLLLSEASSLCEEKISQNKIKLTMDKSVNKINCVKIQIEQVLVNLIGNSIDAIENLSEKWIHLGTKDRGGFLEISVTDSGRGIAKEIQEKLMQPFFTTKPIGKGTGLGLSISKNIVESHGGKFSYDNTSLNSKFVILLPKYKDALLDVSSIDEAIQAHIDWRRKITNYLAEPNGSINFEVVAKENNCALGKWIERNLSGQDDPEILVNLEQIHKDFHRCAGDIIGRASSGEALIAATILGSGSEYDRLSMEILSILQELKEINRQNKIKSE